MTTVYLIRHAEAEGNLYRRAHGHYDATITQRGYRQIAALSARLADERIDAVYTSDLIRTQTTALSVTHSRGLVPERMPELREIGVGIWEDRTWAWLQHFDRERLIAFNTDTEHWHVEGGEDMRRVRERMLGALRSILAAHPGQTVAVFSHGMALRTLIGTLQGLSPAEIDRTGHAENTAVTRVEADAAGIRVVYRDDASHLPEELTTLRRQQWIRAKGGLEPGIFFLPDGADGNRFRAVSEAGEAGAVSVRPAEDGTAELTELRLAEPLRGRQLGLRLLGQAVSRARALGCETLTVSIPEDAPALRRCALSYGFRAAGGTTFALWFGSDALRRAGLFEEAVRERSEQTAKTKNKKTS